MPIDAPCLACGKPGPSHEAHWPEAVGMGRSRKKHPELPTVPACVECHIGGEHTEANPKVIERLIARAPAYWKARGEWDNARPYLERYVSRREYMGAMRG